MFKFLHKQPEANPTDFHGVARQYPGKLVVLPHCIVVYLGDVDVMTTTYVDTRKMSGEECLAAVKSGMHQDRHHQIHL
jgi:hypothetical protein